MKPIVTEEELKSLKLFSYYLQSHGIKRANLHVYLDNCEVEYIDSHVYENGGSSHAEMYDAITNVFESIIENNKLSEVLDDCDNRGSLYFYIDCEDRTLEVEISETYYGVNERSDSITFEDLNENVLKSIEKLFEESDEPKFTVSFNGSGDSGDIETTTSNGLRIDRDIESFLYNWLENFYGGWEINEGSQGYFNFDYESKDIELDFQENTEEERSHDFDFVIKF